jgi:hypothetical protein
MEKMQISIHKHLATTNHLFVKLYFTYIEILNFFKRGNGYIYLPAVSGNTGADDTSHTLIFQTHYCRDSFKDHKLKKSCLSKLAQWVIETEFIQKGDFQILTVTCDSTESFFCRESDNALLIFVMEKLLDILIKRYNAFNGAEDGGVLIFLVGGLRGYAQRLEALLLELSHINRLEPEFLDWIENANYFCDYYC